MKETEPRLAQEVQSWFDRAQAADVAEDAEHGVDRSGDELPAWVANKDQRLAKIREAMASLEREAQGPEDDDPKPPRGGKEKDSSTAGATPPDKAQRNFTDPESKLLKTKDGFIQGYNCQAAVDAHAQIIVACDVAAAQNDAPQFIPMLDQVKTNTGRQAREVSADSGYCSEANLRAARRRRVNGYVATGRKTGDSAKRRRRAEQQGPLTRAMRTKLRRAGHRSRYRLRKQIVEPVFGQIKFGRGFTQFLLRGRANVNAEWALICMTHNLRKLAAA